MSDPELTLAPSTSSSKPDNIDDDATTLGPDNESIISNAEALGPSGPSLLLVQFGPGNSYFMNLRRWSFVGASVIAKKLEALHLTKIYVFGLPDQAGTYIVAGKTTADKITWSFSLPASKQDEVQEWTQENGNWMMKSATPPDAWKKLRSWIVNSFRDLNREVLERSFIVFGALNTYYALSPSGCIWNNIPDELERDIVRELQPGGKGAPISVTLGKGSSWVAFWGDGSIKWRLYDGFDELKKRLQGSEAEERKPKMTSVTLDPYSTDFFAQQSDGGCVVKLLRKGAKDIDKECVAYMQQRARADGTTFTFGNFDGKGKQVIISPTTNHDNANMEGTDIKQPKNVETDETKVDNLEKQLEKPEAEEAEGKTKSTWSRRMSTIFKSK